MTNAGTARDRAVLMSRTAPRPAVVEFEEWRTIPSWPDYEVSDQGRVRRSRGGRGARPGRLLKPERLGRYLVVRLPTDGRARVYVALHDLVAEVFIGSPGEEMEVRHKNVDPRDNRACNLEYVAAGNGTRHAMRLASKARGERINTAKLTETEVREIREAYAGGGVSQKELGRRYGVSQAEVGYIVKRQVWTHI